MRKAIDGDNVRDALKNASNMICELRTSLLSPKNYFELYMQVFNEMQHLSGFFGDKSRHKKKMIDLYESVQHAGNILPRLYLLATVAAAYIKSLEAPAKEILKDVNELCKGVQHPLRGLFLRYYLSQMLKDKLPDTGSGFEGEGGDINDAFEFIFTNFQESNRLWVRIQHQGPSREKDRRERERHDLRVLVGANLVRLSQLDGMTMEFYAEDALPKILDHIVSVKDVMSQQYLLESMIQVFPDEFHIRTLEQMLSSYVRALPNVDMKPIMVTLMNRLANYLSEADSSKVQAAGDIFSLFRSHLQGILERALQPQQQSQGGVAVASPMPDMAPPLEVLAAFMQFTVSLYPDQVHYVDIILGSAAELLQKFKALPGCSGPISEKAADQIGELLAGPMKTLGLGVLKMEHFAGLVGFLTFEIRKQVSLNMVSAIVEDDRALSSVDDVTALFGFISPLLKDEEDTPMDEAKDKARFAEEQHKVCKLVHQVRHEDTDIEFQILTTMRGFFGQGGPNRLVYTLQPIFFAALGLVPKILAREKRRAEEGDDAVPQPAVSMKKVFQFVHKTNTALMQSSPDMALHLWLAAAVSADQVERATGAQGGYEPIAYEFLTQALVLFEEEISDSSKQFKGIHNIVGTLCKIAALDPENFDNVSQKITRHAAKLLKKPMQCRAVAACSQLFWCDARRDAKRVRECLERCVKTCEAVVQSDSAQVGLWVEMFDRYIYYYEVQCEEVGITFLQSLMQICVEHIDFALK
ncbi:VPS35B, partial [Symbiodinium natans]